MKKLKMLNKSIPVKTVRLVTEKRLMSEEILNTPDKVIKMLTKELSSQPRELVAALYLDTALHPISIGIISMGNLNASLVSPMMIFQQAVLLNSANFILAHNHPSGRLIPSKEDIELTKQIFAAGKLMEINMLDHIIIGGGNSLSLRNSNFFNFDSDLSLDEMIAKCAEKNNGLSL